MTLVWSTQSDTPGIPSFWTEESIYLFLSMKLIRRLDSSDMNILPSTFSSEIVWNWFISIEFGANILSEIVQQSGAWPILQITFMSFHSRRANLGQYLYTLYGTPFGPGVEHAFAYF